jgi:4-hydroxy-tetrahydrodipicolinate reductase
MASNRPIFLAVSGASGRMGARIISLAQNDPRFQLVGGIEKKGADKFARFLPGGKAPIVYDINEIIYKTEVVIDFTAPEGVMKLAHDVAAKKRALVVGTTGLSPSSIKKLKDYSRKIPIVFSPNMSVGVNVLFQVLAQAARALAQYDIEVVEAHHNLKKDSPSGTALRLAEIAAEASQRSEKDFVYGRKGLVGARTKKEIGISAVRAGDIVGDHTVYLAGPGERLELTHRAHSRDAFASGALEAAAWAVRQRPGFYSMADVLNLRRK